MKQAYKIPLTAALLGLSLAPGLLGLDRAKIKADIREAIGHFLEPKAGSSDCRSSFLLLIGAVEQAASESGFPAEFGVKITRARRVFESTSILNRDGVALLNEAYALIHDGQSFRFPEGLAGMDGILCHIRKMSEWAQKSLEEGRTGEAVKSVLEILLMIATPVEASNGARA